MRQWWQGRVFPAIALVLLVGIALVGEVLSFEVPRGTPSAQKAQQEQPSENPLAAFWEWTTHDAVATYTAILTLFTGVLAYGTWRLVQDGKAHSRHTLRAYVLVSGCVARTLDDGAAHDRADVEDRGAQAP